MAIRIFTSTTSQGPKSQISSPEFTSLSAAWDWIAETGIADEFFVTVVRDSEIQRAIVVQKPTTVGLTKLPPHLRCEPVVLTSHR